MKTKLLVHPRGMVERKPVDERPPELIKAEREAKALKDKRFAWKGKSKSKSQITEFSYSSRGSAREFTYKLDKINCVIRINPHDSMFHGTGETFQGKLKRAEQFQKELIQSLSGMGYTGVIVRHLQDRKSEKSWYTGQVIPHWHLLVCEPISAMDKYELNEFIVAQMKLPYPWYEKQALKITVMFRDSEATAAALAMDRTRWEGMQINYLTRPMDKNVLEMLDGEPIGRSWFKIGNPKMAKPIELDLEPREHAVFTRLTIKAVNAKIKQLSRDLQEKHGYKFKRTKQMSTALKLHFLNPLSKVKAYLSADTVLRIHNFACSQTLGKKNPRLRPPGDSSVLYDLLPSMAA